MNDRSYEPFHEKASLLHIVITRAISANRAYAFSLVSIYHKFQGSLSCV